MIVHLKSGEVIETEGDYPVLGEDGLYRFELLAKDTAGWATVTYGTNDPLIPFDNILYIEKTAGASDVRRASTNG